MHSTTFLLTVLAFSASTLASPNPDIIGTSRNPQGRKVISHIAKFDNTNGGALAGLPVRGITPLLEYEDLSYMNMGVIVDGDALAGLAPQSAPNVLGYDAVAELQGPQNITSIYKDSITDYFNFKSFYFGCVVDSQESETGVPTSCSITLTGMKGGKTVASQSASFVAKLPSSNMQFVQLGRGFGNVDTVVFKTQGTVDGVVDAVLMDNLAYDAVLKQGY